MFHLIIRITVILTVIRRTRADGETGRTELMDSTAVGRYAGLSAASIATSAIGAAGLLTTGIPPRRSLAFVAVPAGSGKLSCLRRWGRRCRSGHTRAIAGCTWRRRPCSPWWPTGWSAAAMSAPDAITERAGPGTAGAGLQGAIGLTWRLDRGALVLWTVGPCLFGLVMGSVAHGIGDELGDGTVAGDIFARMGGAPTPGQDFIAVALAMVGMVAAAFAISLSLRLQQQESGQGAEATLADVVSRTRCPASYLVATLVASAVAMLVSGLAGGLIYGVAAGDVGGKLSVIVGSTAVQLPAIWLLSAVTVGLFSLAPRFTPVAWVVLVGFIALYLIGSLAGFPQWLLDVEPFAFAHLPRVGSDFTAVPVLWLATDAALIIIGAMAFRRRDLRC